MNDQVLILGAGLTGLSAGYHLKEGYEIFEKEERAGGLCRSEVVDGFTFDYAIHILYSGHPYAAGLIRKLLGENFMSQDRSSWVYLQKSFTRYPFQANTYGLPAGVIKECILGLIRARYENPDGKNPKNFEEWIHSTFGSGIAKYFMIPFNRKCWAIEPSQMGFDWIAERVPMPDLEEVITGALEDQTKLFGPNAQFWYPKMGGIESLPNGFLPYVKDNLYLKHKAVKIHLSERAVIFEDGSERSYSTLISTLPIPGLLKILDHVPEAIQATAERLEHNTIWAINAGIDRDKISEKHWIYYPEDELIFHRISFPMNFSPAMAPEGKSSVTAEVSSSRYKKIDLEHLEERVVDDLKQTGFVHSGQEVLFTHRLKLSPAYVVYSMTHREDVRKILDFLEQNGIYSCGRFGEWEYLNMDHSILSGQEMAEKVKQVDRTYRS